MPVNSTARKFESDVVKGLNTAENANAMQFNTGSIDLTNANDATNASPSTIVTASVEPMGIPVMWAIDDAGTAGSWVIYNDNDKDIAASLASAVKSTLPNEAVIAVVVGSEFGLGFNEANITLDADGEPVTVLFRGANNAGVVRSGIDYTSGGEVSDAAAQLAFEAQLEIQGIMVIDNAPVISPTFTS